VYALLGQSCQTSMSCLVSDNKYLPLNSPFYEMKETKMRHFPTVVYKLNVDADIADSDDLTPQTQKGGKKETYVQPSCGSCGYR
jgi:hypothetical protein